MRFLPGLALEVCFPLAGSIAVPSFSLATGPVAGDRQS